jgi:hypothetical protein
MKVLLAIGLLTLTTVAASAQWQLGKSQHEPCWSIANPVRCDGRYRPENPAAHVLFQMDKGAPQSFWYQR